MPNTSYTEQDVLSSAFDPTTNSIDVHSNYKYTNITASALIKSGAGRFAGFVVNSHTSGTIKVWDSTSATGGVILNTITLNAGPQILTMPQEIQFNNGLYFTLGGVADITVVWI